MRWTMRPFTLLLAITTLTSVHAAEMNGPQLPSVPLSTNPAVVTPPSTAPAPIAPPPLQGPQMRVPVATQSPLIGVWEGANEFKDLRLRETTQIEFRPDGIAVARFSYVDPMQQKREPIVSG